MEATNSTGNTPTKGEVQEIRLSDIHMDAAIQSRDEMSPQQVKNYGTAYRNGAAFPPLVVTTRPGDFPGCPSYLLLDGFHRYQAILNIGGQYVEVKVIETPIDATPHQLRWLGGRENLRNGLPLKTKDKRELFKSYIKAGQHREGRRFKSSREIASELMFCTHQTVLDWMKRFFPSVYRAMKKGGDKVNNKAEGTGNRLVDMPDLSDREFQLFRQDLIELAKASNSDRRYAIRQQLMELLNHLQVVAPCYAPEF